MLVFVFSVVTRSLFFRLRTSIIFDIYNTGTCFIQKIYAPSSSLLQGKHLPFPLPHFVLIFFSYLWSFRWPNYIVILPRYFSFRLPHLNIPTGPPSDELDKNIQRTLHFLLFSHWNGYSHFRSGLNWFRKFKKRCF